MVDQAAASFSSGGSIGSGPIELSSLQPLPAGTGVDGSPLHTLMQEDLHTAAAGAVAGERRGHQGTHGGESSNTKVHPVRCICITGNTCALARWELAPGMARLTAAMRVQEVVWQWDPHAPAP